MYRLFLILLLVLIAMPAEPAPAVTAQQPTCPWLVNQAFQAVDQVCAGADNNQACYAHARLDAFPQAHVASLKFDEAGDIAEVADLQSLRLSPMDLERGWWGVGLLRLRTYVPNVNARQDASILLFGDVTLENRVPSPAISRDLTIRTSDGANARVRTAPYDGLVIAALPDGQVVRATGRTDDGWWVRIELPNTERSGWIYATLLVETSAIADLETVQSDSAKYAPMQAFSFTSGQNDAACSEAPNSGLLVQTPEGEVRVTFLINEVSINLGSTAFIQATPGDSMSIYLIEGSSQVASSSVSYAAVAGTVISIPLDEAGIAAGPPSLPAPYDLADLSGLPVAHLDRAITVAPPLDETALAQLTSANLGRDDSDTDDEGDSGEDTLIDGGGVVDDGDGGVGSAGGTEKLVICHNGHSTITINLSAWPAHQEHGDTVGPCPEG